MKYIISILSAIGVIVILCVCGIFGQSVTTYQPEYLRVHIRANSNSEEDQAVKYLVKDAVVEALIPILADIETKDEAECVMRKNFTYIENIANAVLLSEGFSYKAHAYINNEYFPTRTYEMTDDVLTLAEGYYDALILELGEGVGDNWWCVVYPAFCFTKTKNFDNIVYISKILEIIQNITK